MGRKSRVNYLRTTALSALICLGVGLNSGVGPAVAAPQDGVVVGGSATITYTGPKTDIHQSTQRGIIDWRGFDVGTSETVEFHQPNSTATTLNRVNAANPSQINGQIKANGNVILVNPNGVFFGGSSRVDVNSLVVTSADIANTDFMSGLDQFSIPGSPDAKIINEGVITAKEGGLVGLVAPQIENSGLIEAKLGKVQAVSGDTFTLDLYGDGLISVAAVGDLNTQLVKNNASGVIRADGGVIVLSAAAARNNINNLVNNEGLIEARTISTRKGKIILGGAETRMVQNTGKIYATGSAVEDGGDIEIAAKFVGLGGEVRADGQNGGTIQIKATTLSLADQISAKGLNGHGGTITLDYNDMWETSTSYLNVDGATNGGKILSIGLDNMVSSGHYSALGLGGKGGQIDITSPGIRMLSTEVSASGKTAGGLIRIGGEYQGGKGLPEDQLPNAQIVTLDRGTRIKADGEDDIAEGGTVIIWSDMDTMMLGTISAIPGKIAGTGGFVEVSSGDVLTYGGDIQTGNGTGSNTRPGTILFDPKNIVIASSTFNPTAIIMGRGHSSPNVDLPNLNNGGAAFGTTVSLDGNRIAVGIIEDNGADDSTGRAGAVYLYSFTNSTFSGGVLEGIIGYGYVGPKSINASQLGANDQFGRSVSLNGNRLAVGANGDDGNNNSVTDSGGVYLYSFSDSSFNGGALQGRIGTGYSGTRDYNMTGVLGNSDAFGYAVSLDGTQLAVGSWGGDGYNNAVTNSGDVYLFSFSDMNFSSGVLQARIGHNYTGPKDINVQLDTSDSFGTALSLDANRLVVAARSGDGFNNTTTNSGEVYLFSFSDSTFSGGVLQGRMGKGYTGTKDVNLSLDATDAFGYGVSLDGNRLAIGSYQDDGNANSVGNSGAVYLYTFTDSVFSGAILQGIIGNNYGILGGKNLSRPNESAGSDQLGTAVSLDGNRLIVGAAGDDGPNNENTNQGAIHFYTFTDSSFGGGAYAGSLGNYYTNANSVTLAKNTASDSSADSFMVSVNGHRIALGVPYDDGYGDILGDSGAVYLYSFASDAYDGAILEGIIGAGYVGPKNINMSAYLDKSDLFGSSVSLEGNRLAVGAKQDDASGNTASNSGAVYLFSFTDSVFSGGVLESRLGRNYATGKNLSISNIGGGDFFGSTVSLDGNRLAVGASRDAGNANAVNASGAVYLFTFSDSAFSTPTLKGIIGYGYSNATLTGSYNLSQLGATDLFGEYGLSLDGNRLVVGAVQGDGYLDAAVNSGDVYLFTFSDSIFSSTTLKGTMGYGYSGANDINMSGYLEANDRLAGVALEGSVLALGSSRDDGYNANSATITTDNGAVFVYNFDDLAFNNGRLDFTIGKGFTGGKNIDTSSIANDSDYYGSSISLDQGTLVAGISSYNGYGSRYANSGGAFIYRGNAYDPASGMTFSNINSTTVGITPSALAALLSTPQNVVLQANNDIRIDDVLTVNNASGNGGNLTLQAGRSILINANVTTDNGDLTLYANEDLATGVVNAQRDAGSAVITMANGTTINAGTGNVVIRLEDGTGKTNKDSGFVTLNNITAGTIFSENIDQTSSLVLNGVLTASGAGTPLTLVAGKDFINNYGAGALVTPAGRWLIYSDHPTLDTLNGLIADFELRSCTYGSGCVLGTGNGHLYEYGMKIIRVSVNLERYYGDPNVDNATLQSLLVYTGFETGDSVSDLEVLPTATISATATATAAAGTTHLINIVGGHDTKYEQYLVDPSYLTILKKPVTATWVAPLSKTYGSANPVSTYSNFTFSGFANSQTAAGVNPTIVMDYGTVGTNTGVGTYAANVTFTSANYDITASPTTLTITPKNITASWVAPLSRIYGDSNPGVTTSNFTYSGLISGDTGAAVSAAADFGSITSSTNVGSYNVGASFTSANYTVTNAPTTTLTINKRNITASVDNASRAYGDTNPSFTWADVTWSNLANGEDGSVIDSLTFSSPTATATSNAGTTHALSISGLSDNNYNLTSSTAGTLTIGKRDITASVNNASRAYGDANPVFTWADVTWSNLANSESGSVLDALTLSAPTATATSNAGTTHAISLSGFSDNNYNLTGSTAGTLTIGKRDITATVNNASRAYGDTNPNPTWSDVTWNNLANSENGSVIDIFTLLAPTATATSNAGTTHAISLSGFSDNNYNLTGSTDGTLTIDKRNITATVNNTSRAYGDANPSLTWANVTWSNLANSESGSVLDALTLSSPTATATSNAGTTHAISLSGFSDNNYNLTSSTAGTLTINKRDITATVNNASRVYGDSNPVFTWADVTWSNLANSESGSVLDALTLSASTATATSNAGTTHAISLSGFSDNNYNLTGSTDGTLTIDKRDITATVNNASRAYGDANPSLTWANVTWSNLANGQNGSVIDSLTFAAPTATATSNAGTTHAISLSGFSDNNYNLTGSTDGTLTINQAALTIRANDYTLYVNDPYPSFGYQILGNFKNGENQTIFLTPVQVNAPSATVSGSYAITPSGATALNYDLNFVNGTLTLLDPTSVPPTPPPTSFDFSNLDGLTRTIADPELPAGFSVEWQGLIDRQGLEIPSDLINIFYSFPEDDENSSSTILVIPPKAKSAAQHNLAL
ncbi:MAG: filamentous hemagglutinin N-terminal domain-containing protein [Alphaproteobacteria bacterium]|nr:filamentous hemagglutinin N-terminal domain-containing protein [Alphaproteobacteria bacterium]